MLGWAIAVHRFGSPTLRQARGDANLIRSLLEAHSESSDVPHPTDRDPRIATWQAGLGGVSWLEQLVKRGRAASTKHNGHPNLYMITCRDFNGRLEAALPDERPVWLAGATDVITDRWLGRTTIDAELLAKCDQDEWLLVEAWDES